MSYTNVNIDGIVGIVEKFTSTNGTNILNISLAVDKPHKTPQGEWEFITQWHRVKAIGKHADYLLKRGLDKGDNLIVLNAELENSSYEKNGQTQYVTKVVADFSSEFFVRKKKDNQQQQQTNDINPHDVNFTEIESPEDDDIPF
ncbi:single-stranded DNA-binding protein [Francisella philomiragia]|uniref:Single-stranded DNA-binding protein n=1 Tax=Francisella philomiragia TaxID=28110 RepID=A0A0B6CUK7_9GAMM|nr:single-stranded DNA-binding protein [Francisella philomiragia]AJI54189.1 single-strand binding family protein [Francisella philomiragia]